MIGESRKSIYIAFSASLVREKIPADGFRLMQAVLCSMCGKDLLAITDALRAARKMAMELGREFAIVCPKCGASRNPSLVIGLGSPELEKVCSRARAERN